MKKFLLCVVALFIVHCPLSISPVHADYNQALTTYNTDYSSYRQAYSKFTVAKSAYQTYRTLVAQNNAIATYKTVLTARNQLMGSYFDLLQEKLNATPDVDPLDISAYTNIRANTKSWLSDNQTKVSNSGTLDDLNSASDEFAQRYPQMLVESKQAIGRVLLAKGTHLDRKILVEFDSMTQLTATVSSSADSATQMQRGIIQARSKHDLFLQKQNEAKAIFFPEQRYSTQDLDLLSGQQKTIEANQYLREAVSFLKEIIKSITG